MKYELYQALRAFLMLKKYEPLGQFNYEIIMLVEDTGIFILGKGEWPWKKAKKKPIKKIPEKAM